MVTPLRNFAPEGRCSLEQSIAGSLENLREGAESRWREGEAYIRQEPAKALAWAVAAGYLLRLLPIGALLRPLTSLLVGAVRPAIVLYGLAKACSLVERCGSQTSASQPLNQP